MLLRRADHRLLAGAAVAAAAQLLVGSAQAQRAAAPGTLQPAAVLQPRIDASVVYSDNFDQRAVAPESDLITRLSAGLSLRSDQGSLRGSLDYMLTGLSYARHSERNDLQNALNANLSLDLLDDRLRLLAEARVDRSAVSAFGVQPGTAGDANSNVTEQRSLRLSPQWRGMLGPALRFTAQVSGGVTQASGTSVGDRTQASAALHLEPVERARFGWVADASHVVSDYKVSRTYRTDRASVGGNLTLDALDLQLSVSVGHERSNLAAATAESGTTWGAGLVWQPSPRTKLSLNREQRLVGQTHDLRFEHRLSRAVFTVFSTRSLSTDQQPTGSLLLALIERDPALRAVVQQRLFPGVDPSKQVDLGFLQSAATVQTQNGLSLVWTEPRQILAFNLAGGQTRRVDPAAGLVGDLSLTDVVRQRGGSLSITHRLTPQTNLGILLQSQRSDGGQASLQSRQRSAGLQWTTRLTQDNTLQLGLRRALLATGSAPVTDENAVTASFGLRF